MLDYNDNEDHAMNVQVKVTGLDELKRKYKFASKNADKYMSAAGKEAVDRFVLPVEGIKQYPPATEANLPGRFSLTTKKPMGYYQRGKGYWYPITGTAQKGDRKTRAAYRKVSKVIGYRLRPTSQRYGTKWFVKRVPYGVRVGNSASYAPYLTGASMQSKLMAKYGWRKLVDVANQNMPKITAVFQAWIEKLHKDAKLA